MMKIYGVFESDYEGPDFKCFCLTRERAIKEKEKYDQELIKERNRMNDKWVEKGKAHLQFFLEEDDMHVIREFELLE